MTSVRFTPFSYHGSRLPFDRSLTFNPKMAAGTGLLLINVGTPDSPEPQDVKRYLDEFLMDPLVVDIPGPARYVLVHGIITPGRSKSSGKLYEKVWMEEGSPLLKYGRDLQAAVQTRLPGVRVELGMRYGKPSLDEAFQRLMADPPAKLVVFPLYPQFSLAATRSAELATREIARRLGFSGELAFVPPFYDDAAFLEAFSERIRAGLAAPWDKLLFSYHGLPARQVKRAAPAACQFDEACCAVITPHNRDCYRAQCFETSRRLAALLGLSADQYLVAFQSRLGRTPWIKPHSDVLYEELPKQGVKRLVVASPSFVSDCLETLEEIALRGRDTFLASGGESLRLVPSLNASPKWSDAVVALYHRAQKGA
jgi:protoporphyrin/coproporphyrin ferrochelatase